MDFLRWALRLGMLAVLWALLWVIRSALALLLAVRVPVHSALLRPVRAFGRLMQWLVEDTA